MKCVWMDMSFWPLINGSERAWVLSNAFSFLVLSPLWAAFTFPWQDRAGSQHRCDVQQTISFFFFALLFYLHSLRSQGAPPLWDGGMKWEEQGREWAGEWIKRLLFFFICAFFFSLSFSLFCQPGFSPAVLVSGSPGPGPIFGRLRCGAEVSLRFFGLINIQQADKTEKFKVEIQL